MVEKTSSVKVNKQSKLDGKPKIDSFHNKDGLLLKTYAWVVKNPVGIVILVHGLNSHIRLEYLRHNVEIVNNKKAILRSEENFYLYENSWIENLNKNNYSVYGLDLQGHGQSDGWKNLRSNINKFDDLVYDVIQYINRIHDLLCLSYKKDNNLTLHDNITNTKIPPFYIIGLSMGGNIVLRILEILGKSKDNNNKKVNIRGCISLAGMISIDHLIAKASFKYFYVPLSKFISSVFPHLRVSTGLRFDKFPYVNDILSFDKDRFKKSITSRFGYELLNAIDNLNNDIEYIPVDIPILFIHSKYDSACYYEGVVDFYNKLNSTNKELHTLEEMDHILTMEPGNEKVLEKILDWLSKLSKEEKNN